MGDVIAEILNDSERYSEKANTKSNISKDYIIIDIDSHNLALQLEYLREVFEISNPNLIVTIPNTPSYIMGIISVRGEIVPVISLLDILRINTDNVHYTKIVIVEERIRVAIPFNEIIDLKKISIDDIKTFNDPTNKQNEEFINQEFEYNGNNISIVDLIKIFSSEYGR